MIKISVIICLATFLMGCQMHPSKAEVSDVELLSALEKTILPEIEFNNSHLSDAILFLQGWWTDLHQNHDKIVPLKIESICKPPKDPGVNPFDSNPSYVGPHVGCNLRHINISSTLKPSFREALDAISKSANVSWYIRNGTIYIDEINKNTQQGRFTIPTGALR